METVSSTDQDNISAEYEKEEETQKVTRLRIIHYVAVFKESQKKCKIMQSIMVFLSFLLVGVVRTAQGPSLMDLKKHVKASLEDFKVIFSIGAVTFPLGNLIGAYTMNFFNPMRFLSFLLLLFAILNTILVFAPSFVYLVILFAVNEFLLGLIDSACNIAILKIWGSESDSYFTILHFCLGIGNFFGPILAEVFLQDEEKSIEPIILTNSTFNASMPDSSINISNPLINEVATAISSTTMKYEYSDSPLSPVEDNMWTVLYSHMSITDLQVFHWFLGMLLLGTACLTALVSLLPFRYASADSSSASSPSSSSKINIRAYINDNYLYILLIGAMVIYAFCGNGIYFLIGNFISVHGMYSPLQLTKSEGARTTAVFFGASVISKFLTIIAIDLIKNTFKLVLVNLFFLSLGSWFLVSVGDTSLLLYRVGMGILGLGIGAHFSTGTLWLSKVKDLSNTTTSILLIATSVGAQVFKIPASKYISSLPSLLYYITLGSWATIVVCVVVSKMLITKLMNKKKETVLNRHVIRRNSDSTVSGSIDEA
ncbi:sodium-dependent glucose transporter 1B [Lepeophtheirus salmonis]|uniref:sodium-dependent glucose transporter 1B n=1 Tax=Lepeophtheirus salmonis TaxID=72036 RepID=UPI001AE4CE54|nr:sodium-dependent glucose transporter 1B-like [Lepeophtheirus salmonis]